MGNLWEDLYQQNKPQDRKNMLQEVEKQCKPHLVTMFFGDNCLLDFHLISPLYESLKSIGRVEHVTLFLRSQGGVTEVPWRVISLIREFCSTFSVLIPEIALSGATHIAIAADELVMTELSTLGSVDPTRRHPLSPKDTKNELIPVSVQDLKECIKFIKEQLDKENTSENITTILSELFTFVNPLVIGAIEQSYNLSRLITMKALKSRKSSLSEEIIMNIVEQLAGKYFSHSFPICRTDVETDLKLSVTRPSSALSEAMQQLNLSYQNETSQTYTGQIKRPGVPDKTVDWRCLAFIDTIKSRKALCQFAADQKVVHAQWM